MVFSLDLHQHLPDRENLMFNGHTEAVLKWLKLSIGIVLVGGGSAFTAGKMAASEVDTKLHVHTNTEHTVLAQQAARMEKKVDQAAYDSQYARIMIETLLRSSGVAIPPPPDGGVKKDGGR